jgi:hypothetical protein
MIHSRVRLGSIFSKPYTSCSRAWPIASRWKPLRELPSGELATFRREAFAPAQPTLLPRGQFFGLPAIQKWFMQPRDDSVETSFNLNYLSGYGSAIVPLEFTRLRPTISAEEAQDSFQRAEAPFQIFLDWTRYTTMKTTERLYLAQASFANLPAALTEDLPTPEIVTKAGTGDIYDTNIWLGIPPTYTPLHRDPNPNLFVQLAGHKIVRVLPPDAGDRVFARVQSALGKAGSASFRGEEMMKGKEKKMLEFEVWDNVNDEANEGFEAHMWDGDGLFIPKGWWHSIKGVDGGVLGSVNWWFR